MRAIHYCVLAFLILALWATNYPLLRPTGDEKVYIAQALEMSNQQNWFLQIFKEQSYYFKGPLFYILLRLGWIIFAPFSFFSLFYMNVLAMLAALLFFNKTLHEANFLSATHSASLSFLTFCSIGTFSHMYASQMESLLILTYVLVLYLLNKIMHEARLRRAGEESLVLHYLCGLLLAFLEV